MRQRRALTLAELLVTLALLAVLLLIPYPFQSLYPVLACPSQLPAAQVTPERGPVSTVYYVTAMTDIVSFVLVHFSPPYLDVDEFSQTDATSSIVPSR